MSCKDTVNYVVDPYLDFMNLVKKKGYVFKSIVGSKEMWEYYFYEHYQQGANQIFSLGGDYEDALDFIQDKQDAFFFRQSFSLRTKNLTKQNQKKIPQKTIKTKQPEPFLQKKHIFQCISHKPLPTNT